MVARQAELVDVYRQLKEVAPETRASYAARTGEGAELALRLHDRLMADIDRMVEISELETPQAEAELAFLVGAARDEFEFLKVVDLLVSLDNLVTELRS